MMGEKGQRGAMGDVDRAGIDMLAALDQQGVTAGRRRAERPVIPEASARRVALVDQDHVTQAQGLGEGDRPLLVPRQHQGLGGRRHRMEIKKRVQPVDDRPQDPGPVPLA